MGIINRVMQMNINLFSVAELNGRLRGTGNAAITVLSHLERWENNEGVRCGFYGEKAYNGFRE